VVQGHDRAGLHKGCIKKKQNLIDAGIAFRAFPDES
jgi:hypothetical protein